MRHIFVATAAALVGLAGADCALAQGVDRYGGVATYPAPNPPQAQPQAQPQPQPQPQPRAGRVLSWPGKAVPIAPPPQQNGYGYPGYVQAQPSYGAQQQPAPYAVERRPATYPQPQPQYAYPAQPYPQPVQPQQARPQGAYPQASYPQAGFASPYQAQPYYAPAPAAAPIPSGSTASAPSGVYPANTVPPQLAYPMAVPPQMAAPLVNNPQLPTSIYAPPPVAAQRAPSAVGQTGQTQADPRQPQRVAVNDAQPGQGARYYSLHRQYGLTPDPTPALPPAEGQAVDLVSAIDPGVGAEPVSEPRTRVIQTNGKTGTAVLRGSSDANPDPN
jgi:hypothetical protein